MQNQFVVDFEVSDKVIFEEQNFYKMMLFVVLGLGN